VLPVGEGLVAGGDFLGGRLAAEALGRLVLGALVLGDDAGHVDGDADGADGVGERAADGLADPPRGVGREAALLLGVEALDSAEEAEVAFGDEIAEREAAVPERAGDVDDEAKVRLDELLARLEGVAADVVVLRVHPLEADGEAAFFLRGEQRDPADLAQVGIDFGIAMAEYGLGHRGPLSLYSLSVDVPPLPTEAASKHIKYRS